MIRHHLAGAGSAPSTAVIKPNPSSPLSFPYPDRIELVSPGRTDNGRNATKTSISPLHSRFGLVSSSRSLAVSRGEGTG